jgi:hypothetical protein
MIPKYHADILGSRSVIKTDIHFGNQVSVIQEVINLAVFQHGALSYIHELIIEAGRLTSFRLIAMLDAACTGVGEYVPVRSTEYKGSNWGPSTEYVPHIRQQNDGATSRQADWWSRPRRMWLVQCVCTGIGAAEPR